MDKESILKMMKKQEKTVENSIRRFFMTFVTVLLLISNIPVNNLAAVENKTLSYKNEEYEVILTYDENAEIPEGSVLKVEEIDSETDDYDEYSTKTKDLLKWENEDFKLCSFLQITILDGADNVVIPKDKVSIKLVLPEEKDDEEKELVIDSSNVIALNDDSTLINGYTADTIVSDDDDISLEFDKESDEETSFPVVVLAQTVKEKVIKASDDNSYIVQAVYDADSGIPLDAEMVVSEIKEDDENYDTYVEKSVDKLCGSTDNVLLAKPFDISFIDPETKNEYQPSGNVLISIRLLNEDFSQYENLDIVHIHGKDNEQIDVVKSDIEEDSVNFVTDGLSVFVVFAYTTEASEIKEYAINLEDRTSINLSELIEDLNITEFTISDVSSVSSNNEKLTVSVTDEGGDWTISVLESFSSGTLTLTLTNNSEVRILVENKKVTPAITPPEGLDLVYNGDFQALVDPGSVTVGDLMYSLKEDEDYSTEIPSAKDPGNYTIYYKVEGDDDYESVTGSVDSVIRKRPVTVTADDNSKEYNSGDDPELSVEITGLITGDTIDYEVNRAEGENVGTYAITPTGEAEQGNYTVTYVPGTFTITAVPVTLTANSGWRNYDGNEKVLSGFTSSVGGLSFPNVSAEGRGTEIGEYDVTFSGVIIDATTDSTGNYVVHETIDGELNIAEILSKELIDLDGNWATWLIRVNQNSLTLNNGNRITLKDTFTANQSIDYSSVQVSSGVTYDYRGQTGTFSIPDETSVTISYRCRVKTVGASVEVVDFGNTALLEASGTEIDSVTTDESHLIYPSASDVAGNTGKYMVKLYVYGDANMQAGISGAQFILLDSNKRPMVFKKGDNAGQDVTFTTNANGWVDIELDEEEGDVSIEKNTSYYLEMIKAPDGYKLDSTLYNFMITDDPNYNSGGVWAYYNGDTIKVRLYAEEASLNVSLRFSGNYELRTDQQNNIVVSLEKKNGSLWEPIEQHSYSEFVNGSITFDYGSTGNPFELNETYRVVETGEEPWDLPDGVDVTTTYYLIVGSEESENSRTPKEFLIDDVSSCINVVINNEYEEPKLTITKMNKITGETLSGAVFTVKKAEDDTVVTSFTTGDDGLVVIAGGSPYEQETLYYVEETTAPEHYLLPNTPVKTYFYFCEDQAFIPEILAYLPEGETAVNLADDYDSLSLDNQKENLSIPVMVTWQGNRWPDNVDRVEIGLYQSVNKAEPTPVYDTEGDPMKVFLTRTATYNDSAFVNLPTRDANNNQITYSIKEEHVYKADDTDIIPDYVQEYGVSDAGVYIVRNMQATSLTIDKYWYDYSGQLVTDSTVLNEQSEVIFDVYRSTTMIPDEIREGNVTHDEMASFVNSLRKVRSNLTFGKAQNWTLTINDLEKKDNSDNPYYYYVFENVPSFGDEIYVPNEANGEISIRNTIAPETVKLTVSKEVKDDPRPESYTSDFTFTLLLKKGENPIRNYSVGDSLTTNWNGEVSFTLKHDESIELTLPAGVTATITETYNPEFVVTTTSAASDLDPTGRVFSYDTTAGTNVSVKFINTLKVICKIEYGQEVTLFESLKSALRYIRNFDDYFRGEATIQMLVDYEMPSSDVFDVRDGEKITLTTAATTGTQFPFVTDRTENVDTAIITRDYSGGSLFTNAGELILEKVWLDGAKDFYSANADGGLINNSGTLSLNNGVTLQNSKSSGKGGAIYNSGTVNMVSNTAVINNSASNASAIYLAASTLNISGGTISNNTGASNGAVVVEDTSCRINLYGSPVIFNNTNTSSSAANIYLGADSDNVINVISPGLEADALIGVWGMESHREIGEQFASSEYEVTANLNRFVNDQYDYRGKLKEGTSTNIIWDGLSLTISKVTDPVGANPDDSFTITLTSASIRKSNYTINGSYDYTVTPARTNRPGTIVFNNVRAGNNISISPLPVGTYTISESESYYEPEFTAENTDISQPVEINDGVFALDGNTTLTVTNTRRLADVSLTKTLTDKLLGSAESKEFNFEVKLTEVDGTAVANFALGEGITTGTNGVASFTMTPLNYGSSIKNFVAPVGAKMEITEVADDNYRLTTSAKTKQGTDITDLDTDHDNIFSFVVTDDGADVSFTNVRKLVEIELSKELVNKVLSTEPFEFTITLIREDGNPASNYVLYDDEDPEKRIVTDDDGKATVNFDFGPGESSKSVKLSMPEGTKLTVAETVIKKNIGGTDQEIYNTTYSVNGGNPVSGETVTIQKVKDTDNSIAFKNTRKTQTITVKNTVSGYSGNVVPFTFTAKVDGGANDYNVHEFENGVLTFELTTGQSKSLTVPYGSTFNVTESFVVGYETTVKRGSAAAVTALSDEFVVSKNENVAFNNVQLIGLVIENNTSSPLNNVEITFGYATRMYRVNDEMTGQTSVPMSGNKAIIDIAAGKKAILEVNHQNSVTYAQDYSVKGSGLAENYYYTIVNEPSFHEYADPAILRIYGSAEFEVKGKLRYSVADSTVTFTEQPLVSFDVNGGVWTTEMEGYRDRDNDQKVYQKTVDKGTAVSAPDPEPVYSAEGVIFLGWTTDRGYANQNHSDGQVDPDKLYNFDDPVNAPVDLYAIWSRGDTRTATVKNSLAGEITVTATLSRDGESIPDHLLFVYESIEYRTDADGKVSFSLPSGQLRNLSVPESGTMLALESSEGNCIAYSSTYSDADTVNSSFTINPVDSDGTVVFIAGICKITDGSGNVLYKADGSPAVYSTLEAAFTDYNGVLYTDASHTSDATQAAVKMLIDEYAISNKQTFPTKDMILTTAGKNDADFPYVGVNDHSTLYRAAGFNNDSLFTFSNTATSVTLTNIILDGKNVTLNKAANGSLIRQNKEGSTLNIETGTTLCNVKYSNYTDGSNSLGGAVYVTEGTLNVNAGLFSNLHARRGGAICSTGNKAYLNVSGSNGSTKFENCYSDYDDGGAIYYYNETTGFVINGGNNKEKPGIIFNCCKTLTKDGDGGAVYANTNYNNSIEISGCEYIECSANNNSNESTKGYGGGAICAMSVKSLAVSYCKFTKCDTLCGGGAIATYVKTNESGVTISYCLFDSCSCKSQGGALAAYQDNNGAKTSNTKLTITNSSFNDCSSGTNNSSGGAIQCYLPCMEFTNTTFADCWAGKEGGAVNHYFGSNYTEEWSKSSVIITNCNFYRCRAEDRYDTGALQHYGGGMNTKAKIVQVTGSYFEDCVSTLKEGGALHLGGQGSNSKSTINNSTFKNCTAKNGGGALLSSALQLEINNSNFYGCSSSASNGGAIYHYRNSRGDSTQNTTTITNSTFSAEPGSEGENKVGCSAANNGGAIWTRAKNVIVQDCTIDSCSANGNGGAVYLSNNSSENAIISGNTKITNCEAVKGSAVYTEYSTTFKGVNIENNTCSDINDGAIHGGTLYFEGKAIIKNNNCSEDSIYKHDVLMQIDNSTMIYTTINGLDESASIGVYVPDQYFNRRGIEGKAFGTWVTGGDNYLDCFFNDRDDGLFGYQSSSSDNNIYWGVYLCKITDAQGNTLRRANGRDAIYQRLTMALDDFTSVTGGDPVYIKILIENYNVQQNAQIENFPNADITLTTETYTGTDPVEGKYDGKHPYRGTEGTVCTISRTNSNNQLFKLSNANATFRLENISFDGRKDKTSTVGDFRMIEASAGSLIINGGTTFRYGYSGNNNGGAINISSANASLQIHSSKDGNVVFDHCTQINSGNNGGGAIYSLGSVTIDNNVGDQAGGKVSFADCNARRGGAIMINNNSANVQISVAGAEFINCNSVNEGGAIYVNNNNNTASSTTIKDSSFENCYTIGNEQWSYGGAVDTKTAYLTIDNCNFKGCYAKSNGGAVNHGSNEVNRIKTTIINTSFENCSTVGTNSTYGLGGSVSTYAENVEVTDSSFTNSTASSNGGALYCLSETAGSAVVSGTSFTNCASNLTNGYGGAIYAKVKTLTLQNSESGKTTNIKNCSAKGYSGAVHMATNNSTLNIKDNTLISGSYADKGAVIYLINTATLKLTGSPEFTKNGYTSSGLNATEGACIYLAEGSLIDLSGSPKFSRNNITNVPRVTNGGTTDYVRQDIYLAGYHNIKAVSIHVSGELTGDTIWVWPEQSPHRLPEEQFATTEANVSADSLEKFRNALDDPDTTCSHGEYLAGVRLPNKDSTGTIVYWDKMYSLSFKKIDNKAVAVADAYFTLFTDKDCTQVYRSAKSANGETDTDPQGEILARGVVQYNSIPIGVYYMKETVVPVGYKANDVTYIVLVGSPSLEPNDYNRDLWYNGGPLDVDNAPTLVAKHTVNSGKYYGVFALKADGKADLSRSIASANAGIVNTRKDYEAYFMKTDSEGLPLPNTAFTLYTIVRDEHGEPQYYDNNYPVLELWSRDGETYPDPAVSADGTSKYKKADGGILPKGLVYFRELPVGTYYLLETAYPDRNGNNRRAFFVESDRLFKLVVNDNIDDFVLSEWQEDGSYIEVIKKDGYFTVSNTEAVVKLTDNNDVLLYTLGHDGESLFPAIYSSLENGFKASQTGSLYNSNGEVVADSSHNPALKLKMLKDFTIKLPITYSSERNLTLTTAERSAPSDKDRYIFSTTRTSDTSRAEVSRGYDEDTSDNANRGALITVSGNSELTLQNVNFNGHSSDYNGRAIHVTDGSLKILNATRFNSFKQEAAAGSADEYNVRGGAILMDSGTSLYINGTASNRSAVFTNNQVKNNRTGTYAAADGGAIAIGDNCTVNISNAQFTGNIATSAKDGSGLGGAIKLENTTLNMTDVVMRQNSAYEGSAIYAINNAKVYINGGSINGNTTEGTSGGAINVGGVDSRIYFSGSPYVFENYDSTGTKQKDMVLNYDTNTIIRTASNGLTGGTIGVYVVDGPDGSWFKDHGQSGKPFGTFENPQKLDVFRNDRLPELYGVRNEDDTSDVLIYWVNIGVSVAFKKIDSFGNPLDGATFTLYTDRDCTHVYEKDNHQYAVAISANGTTTKNSNNDILNKGTVLFEEIYEGIYYLKERRSSSSGSPEGYLENAKTYVVLIGKDTQRPADTSGTIWAQGRLLENITQTDVNVQIEKYNSDKAYYKLTEDYRYAIFLIDENSNSPTYGKAVSVPNIAKYGVQNDPENKQLTILEKTNNGNPKVPLSGAVFEVLRYDRTKIYSYDINDNMTSSFISGSNGVYFVDNLPYGTYYLHETGYPDGVTGNGSVGWWYILTVNEDGVSCSGQLSAEPS